MAVPDQRTMEPILPAAFPETAPGTRNGVAGQMQKDTRANPVTANAAQSTAPELMSQEEFDRKNSRRCDLIRKDNRLGLSPEERRELEYLEAEVDAWVEARFPLPPVNTELLKELARHLGTAPELPQEK